MIHKLKRVLRLIFQILPPVIFFLSAVFFFAEDDSILQTESYSMCNYSFICLFVFCVTGMSFFIRYGLPGMYGKRMRIEAFGDLFRSDRPIWFGGILGCCILAIVAGQSVHIVLFSDWGSSRREWMYLAEFASAAAGWLLACVLGVWIHLRADGNKQG